MKRRLRAGCLAVCLAMTSGVVSAEELAEKLRLVRPELAESPFGRPLLLESSEEGGDVRGNVVALVDHPIADLRARLDTPAEWCEVLILHLNVKSCVPGQGAGSGSLALLLGRKGSEDGDGSHSLDFMFRVPESSAERFRVAMEAASGPLGTTAYRMSLEAIPVGARSSFLRLTYAYAYGTAARIAMSSYLGTLGKGKVGFSSTAGRSGESPVYVGGLRGVLERNTMRYFLGIETVLDSAAQPAESRAGWRFHTWFDATERYPRQLHELTKAEYLAGKRDHSSSRVTDPARRFARVRAD